MVLRWGRSASHYSWFKVQINVSQLTFSIIYDVSGLVGKQRNINVLSVWLYVWYESRKMTVTAWKIPLLLHKKTRVQYCQHCIYQQSIPVIPPLVCCHFGFTPQTKRATFFFFFNLFSPHSPHHTETTAHDSGCQGREQSKIFLH